MDRPQPKPFPLAPVAASILAERETERRNHLRQLGYFKTACSEIDDYVLLGGLERGHVVGLSAEEESFGVAVCFPPGPRSPPSRCLSPLLTGPEM